MKILELAVIVGAAMFVALAAAQVPRTKAPAGASVYFVSPADGATVKGPVKVVMSLSGMGGAPAGVDVPDIGAGCA